MKLGIVLPHIGRWATAENVVKVAQNAEDVGYHSLWVSERLLWPLEPRSYYPITDDGRLPETYQYVLDPIVALTYAAANTQRIRIGTSAVIMPYHTPIVLGKQLATLDVISGGRLNCGLALGWSEDEYDATNTPFKDRGDRGDEFLKCLKVIWAEDEPEFHGKFYHVPKSKINPKPIQKPHPPITIGGFNPRAFKRAVTLGDGYNGIILPFDQMGKLIEGLKQSAGKAGRRFGELQVVCRGTPKLVDQSPEENRYPLTGTLKEVKDDLKRLEEMGVTEVFFDLNSDFRIKAGNYEARGTMDELLLVMEKLRPF